MFSSFLRPCFSCDSYVDPEYQKPFPKSVEVLRQAHVSCTPKTLTQQLLTPLDLFPFCLRQYLPWAVFFNYDIEFDRLVEALHIVAQKYRSLCGRLSTDDKGRYVIEVCVFLSSTQWTRASRLSPPKEDDMIFQCLK